VTPEPDSPESTETSTGQPAGFNAQPPTPAAAPASPQERLAAIANERPEAAAGAAFAGGLLFALILKRLAR
jgi:hypothetical protein